LTPWKRKRLPRSRSSGESIAPVGRDTRAPYEYPCPSMPAGDHTLRAVATDNAGAVSASGIVRVRGR